MNKTLYVHRNLLNTKDLIKFYGAQGIKLDHALHVTICFSNAKVDWEQAPKPQTKIIQLARSNFRKHLVLGKKFVLKLDPPSIKMRHEEYKKIGATWDFPTYMPHVSLCDVDSVGINTDINKIKPWTGKILFGSEIYEEVKEN
jgi:uncharacterized protein